MDQAARDLGMRELGNPSCEFIQQEVWYDEYEAQPVRVGGPPCIANGVMDALSEFGIAQLLTPQNVCKGDQRGASANRLSFSRSAHPPSQSYRKQLSIVPKKPCGRLSSHCEDFAWREPLAFSM
jgi:hypothetical protein